VTLGINSTTRSAMVDTITTRAGASALLRIYDGSQPATGGTATTLLAELTCNATFAPGASSGVLTLNAITSDTSANATGTATWFRIVQSDGSTHVLDGTVGTSGADLNLNTTSIVSGATVAVSSFTITAGNA
jgi:hypothetical protein